MLRTLWAIQALMFGHTLLRLDPKDQKQLNLISYAVNYAATVTGQQVGLMHGKDLQGNIRVNIH